MAFYSDGNQQFRLTLSRLAEEVIQNDMMIFNETRRNSFINTIVRNYYLDADASIALRLSDYQDYLCEKMGEDFSLKIVRPLIDAKREELYSKVLSYKKEKKDSPKSPIRLQNSLLEELTNESVGPIEEAYENNLSKYLCTLLEEYARLPFKEREKIYSIEKYNSIKGAIDQKCQLLVFTSNEKCFHVLPYIITDDPLGLATYLVGFSYKNEESRASKIPSSFRISTLKSIKLEKSKSARINQSEEKAIENAIATNGVQFLVSDTTTIKIKLTKQGIDAFNHQLNLRPTPVYIEDNIYTFKCSLIQAQFYFFKFGSNAEVLEPQQLRNKFISNYRAALKQYETSQQ